MQHGATSCYNVIRIFRSWSCDGLCWASGSPFLEYMIRIWVGFGIWHDGRQARKPKKCQSVHCRETWSWWLDVDNCIRFKSNFHLVMHLHAFTSPHASLPQSLFTAVFHPRTKAQMSHADGQSTWYHWRWSVNTTSIHHKTEFRPWSYPYTQHNELTQLITSLLRCRSSQLSVSAE